MTCGETWSRQLKWSKQKGWMWTWYEVQRTYSMNVVQYIVSGITNLGWSFWIVRHFFEWLFFTNQEFNLRHHALSNAGLPSTTSLSPWLMLFGLVLNGSVNEISMLFHRNLWLLWQSAFITSFYRCTSDFRGKIHVGAYFLSSRITVKLIAGI